MASIMVIEGHNLGAAEAKKRIDSMLYTASIDGQISNSNWRWNGLECQVSFTIFGVSGSGLIVVTDARVQVSGTLPLIARPFSSRIEAKIREWIQKALNSKGGENEVTSG